MLLLAQRAEGAIFVLTTGGEVRGELINPEESPRTKYLVKTTSGGAVILAAQDVREVLTQSPAEMKYDRYRVDCPDTVDGHWKMAQWCHKNRLSSQRVVHLERILELDPDHAEARRGLGYSKINGRWATQEQVMSQGGYIRSKLVPGKWILPQEEELLARKKQVSNVQLEWNSKLKRWSNWLNTDKHSQALAAIEAIDDVDAVRGLTKSLEEDKRRDARLIYLKALSRINAPASLEVLVNLTLHDGDEEIRLAALDEIVARSYSPATIRYVQALRHKDNVVVNRAAVALGRMQDPLAIEKLLDALVTTHTFIIQKGQAGQTSAAFGNLPGGGGGGYSFGGGGSETVKRQLENPDVLQALIKLTEGVSFNFDVNAWKHWYTTERKPKTLDARRDAL